MDKKYSNKFSNFFKKEVFYVALFFCLCILAAVAIVTTKYSKQAKKLPSQQPSVVQNQSEKETAKNTEQPYKDYDNALQVKEKAKAKSSTAKKNNDKTAAVSKTTDTKFAKPVEGILARAYSEEPVFWKSTNSYRPNFGMDIKCEVGKPVFCVLDGKIENVQSDSSDGVKVTVNHQNGLKTVYSNLDPKVIVKKDQVVKKGDKIGAVGKTTVRALYETYGDHLHFSVLKNGDFINPSKYIKY
ncbi:M23 family metallopeptidase [Clostridium rectalis]|uniref:M23 family metallopeptidase n=1 Tax=Clostridium rectalis TaxID=2040295 RepID=UPI000F638008|nr:M23 family metallopeptidase [Clostridium rectalis]